MEGQMNSDPMWQCCRAHDKDNIWSKEPTHSQKQRQKLSAHFLPTQSESVTAILFMLHLKSEKIEGLEFKVLLTIHNILSHPESDVKMKLQTLNFYLQIQPHCFSPLKSGHYSVCQGNKYPLGI